MASPHYHPGMLDPLTEAVATLYERAIDRVLLTPERVTTAAEGRALLAAQERHEALAEQIQKVVVLAVPVARAVAAGARFTRVPWVLVSSTALSIGLTVRAGVREVQVLASLLAHRLEQATGHPPDRALVEKLTIELYLAPKKTPDVSDRRLRAGRLVRRWIFRGAFGRETRKDAGRALDQAERLDLHALAAQWRNVT
jgi:hypothetical protein